MPIPPPERTTEIRPLITAAGSSSGVRAVAMRLEPHAVHAAIHLAVAEDGLDLIGQRHVLGEVHDLVPGLLYQRESLLVRVADDDAGRAEQAALLAAQRPTGPAPAMYTVDPGLTPASAQPW